MVEHIKNLGINFADDESRRQLFSFHRAVLEGVAERPLLVICGLPGSHKRAVARLALALTDAPASESCGLEIVGNKALISLDHLVMEPEELATAALIVTRIVGQPKDERAADFAVVITHTWCPLLPSEEVRAWRVALLPAMEISHVGEVS